MSHTIHAHPPSTYTISSHNTAYTLTPKLRPLQNCEGDLYSSFSPSQSHVERVNVRSTAAGSGPPLITDLRTCGMYSALCHIRFPDLSANALRLFTGFYIQYGTVEGPCTDIQYRVPRHIILSVINDTGVVNIDPNLL